MAVHTDPDFATLPPEARLVVAGALVCGTEHHPVSGPGGLTPLQKQLVEALAVSCLGVDLAATPATPTTPDQLAAALEGHDENLRHRVAQFFLVLELVADPLPPEVTESVDVYLRRLGVEDDLQVLARDYAEQAYGLALKDLQRKGYFADFAHREGIEERMHVHGKLASPFALADADPELEAEWRALESLPAGTLGRKIWEFYVGRGFVFPGAPGSVSPTLAQHDWVHVLADYGTVVDSELEVFGFIATAIPDPRGFSFLAAILGLFETGHMKSGAGGVLQSDPHHLRRPGMPLRLADAMHRGRICGRDVMYGVDYFDYVKLPIAEAREALSIVPKSEEAVAAGSVGVWDPGGITAFQREHGDPRFQPRAGETIER